MTAFVLRLLLWRVSHWLAANNGGGESQVPGAAPGGVPMTFDFGGIVINLGIAMACWVRASFGTARQVRLIKGRAGHPLRTRDSLVAEPIRRLRPRLHRLSSIAP